MKQKKRFIVAITGASGAILGIRLLEALRSIETIESHLIMSPVGRVNIEHETSYTVKEVEALADKAYVHQDVSGPLASGSFDVAGMLIVPCSIKTLSAVANCYASDLVARAADCCLKEGRPLLIAVRETPFHLGHLRLMVRATEMGAVIFPPVPAFYAKPHDLDDMVRNLVGRMLSRIGVNNELFLPWMGLKAAKGLSAEKISG